MTSERDNQFSDVTYMRSLDDIVDRLVEVGYDVEDAEDFVAKHVRRNGLGFATFDQSEASVEAWTGLAFKQQAPHREQRVNVDACDEATPVVELAGAIETRHGDGIVTRITRDVKRG